MFVRPFIISHGIIEMGPDEIRDFQDDLQIFHSRRDESIFVVLIGAPNHWSTLVIHKKFVKIFKDENKPSRKVSTQRA